MAHYTGGYLSAESIALLDAETEQNEYSPEETEEDVVELNAA
jgi:hypothetical protein